MRRMALAALAALAALLVAGCFSGPSGDGGGGGSDGSPSTSPAPPADPVRFVLTGDTGTGSDMQYAVGRAIGAVCAERGCDFMAILGDLVYDSGVSSPYDPQFEEKFERPYANLSMPVYTVLGNHDNSWDPSTGAHGQDVGLGHWYAAGNHMVAYHYRTDRMSDKWQMPARYYSFQFGDAAFFALDSNTMMYGDAATGSTDPQAYEHALAQATWFDHALAASDARWRFTLAHHPYVSNGQHGDAGSYDDQGAAGFAEVAAPGLDGAGVKRFFDEHVCASGKVDLHFAGHDHDLQWLRPVPACGDTEFIVSGGGGAPVRGLEEDPSDDSWFGLGGVHGFFWVELTHDAFRGVVFDKDGKVLYERTLTKA